MQFTSSLSNLAADAAHLCRFIWGVAAVFVSNSVPSECYEPTTQYVVTHFESQFTFKTESLRSDLRRRTVRSLNPDRGD
jgi:hypothetical protein